MNKRAYNSSKAQKRKKEEGIKILKLFTRGNEDCFTNSKMKCKNQTSHLLSFKRAMIPAASAGETGEGECCRSAGLCKLKLLEALLLGVVGWEELGELTREEGYQE